MRLAADFGDDADALSRTGRAATEWPRSPLRQRIKSRPTFKVLYEREGLPSGLCLKGRTFSRRTKKR